MKKIASWLVGLSAGAAVATVLVALFVPASSKDVRQRLRNGYNEAMNAAQEASEQRRRELEKQLESIGRKK